MTVFVLLLWANGVRVPAVACTHLSVSSLVAMMNWPVNQCMLTHLAAQSMNVLREVFPGHLISKSGNIPCPSRSYDLRAPYIFLWGRLKCKMCATCSQSAQELKDYVLEKTGRIDVALLQRVMQIIEVSCDSS
jgi:hypothetical protein